jgi:protein required for attachment to host cells
MTNGFPIIKQPITWVLIADGRQAQIYVRERAEKRGSVIRELTPIADMRREAEPVTDYETGRNATGMVFESVGGARHMSEPHMDVREKVKQHLATEIADALDAAKTEKRFDHLILAAPPKMLGEIKKRLSKPILKCVIAALPKELTHCDVEELRERLRGVFQPII